MRHIIHRNPPRVDHDGDVIEDDEGSNPDLTAAEEDPYADIHIQSAQSPRLHPTTGSTG